MILASSLIDVLVGIAEQGQIINQACSRPCWVPYAATSIFWTQPFHPSFPCVSPRTTTPIECFVPLDRPETRVQQLLDILVVHVHWVIIVDVTLKPSYSFPSQYIFNESRALCKTASQLFVHRRAMKNWLTFNLGVPSGTSSVIAQSTGFFISRLLARACRHHCHAQLVEVFVK